MSAPMNSMSDFSASSAARPVIRGEIAPQAKRSLSPSSDKFIRSNVAEITQNALPPSQITELANCGALLKPEQLKAAMSKAKDFHYGNAPADLRTALSQSEGNIQTSLNHLAKGLYKNRLWKGESQPITLKKGGAAQLEYLGEGMHSVVYKITVGPSSYALKVFRPGTAGTNIPYQEVVNGAFLNAHKVKDVSRLHMANPAKNWTLMEYIPPNASLDNRSGHTMEQLNFAISDEGAKNRINEILIDHGGTLSVPSKYQVDAPLFQQALNEIHAPSLLKRILR